MKRFGIFGAIAALCALSCVGSAAGQSAQTLTVLDGNRVPTTIAGQKDNSGNFHYRDVMEGLDSSGNPYGLNVDPSSHDLIVYNLGTPLQAGGSIGNTAFGVSGAALTDLNAIAAGTPTLNGDGGAPAHVTNWPSSFWQATQPVSAAALPLPSNAAQETGGNLATIASNTNGVATASNQTAIEANAGSNSSKATGVQGVSGGVPVGETPSPTSSSSFAIAPGIAGSAASSVVLKASAGNLYSVYASASAAGWLMVFNSTTAPSNGSTTAGTASGNMEECIAIPAAGTTGGLSFAGQPPESYSVGITAVFSSTGCGTLTTSATAFLHGAVQ
jgi:hypothetical protein